MNIWGLNWKFSYLINFFHFQLVNIVMWSDPELWVPEIYLHLVNSASIPAYALIIVNNNNFTIVFDLKFYLDEYILPKIAERDLRRFCNLTHTSSALGVDTVILLLCSQLGVEILQIRALYQKCCRKNSQR